MKKQIESLSTDYYNIKYWLEDKGNNFFVGEALISRRDTGEQTKYGCVKYGNNIDEIEK